MKLEIVNFKMYSSTFELTIRFVLFCLVLKELPCLRLHISSSLLVGSHTHFPAISLQLSPSKQGGSHKESAKHG